MSQGTTQAVIKSTVQLNSTVKSSFHNTKRHIRCIIKATAKRKVSEKIIFTKKDLLNNTIDDMAITSAPRQAGITPGIQKECIDQLIYAIKKIAKYP